MQIRDIVCILLTTILLEIAGWAAREVVAASASSAPRAAAAHYWYASSDPRSPSAPSRSRQLHARRARHSNTGDPVAVQHAVLNNRVVLLHASCGYTAAAGGKSRRTTAIPGTRTE